MDEILHDAAEIGEFIRCGLVVGDDAAAGHAQNRHVKHLVPLEHLRHEMHDEILTQDEPPRPSEPDDTSELAAACGDHAELDGIASGKMHGDVELLVAQERERLPLVNDDRRQEGLYLALEILFEERLFVRGRLVE